MEAIIGDIGNTITKVCLINTKNFKIKREIYFDSNKILSKNLIKKKLKKILKNISISKFALFSSVVPKYHLRLKKILKKFYKINIKEFKDRDIN